MQTVECIRRIFYKGWARATSPRGRVRMGVFRCDIGKRKLNWRFLVVTIQGMPPNPDKSFKDVRDYLAGLQGFPRANLTVSKS